MEEDGWTLETRRLLQAWERVLEGKRNQDGSLLSLSQRGQ